MVSEKFRPVAESANATKDGLEPFRWIGASRCATRGTIENGLHYVKDVTLGEDRSTVHADNGPKIMAALRNTAVSLLRRAGFSPIAARMRYNSIHPEAALQVLSCSLFENA